MDATLKVTKDDTAKLFKTIAAIAKTRALIGVTDPEVAVYAYVQEFGSPAQNIPALHFMEFGIADARKEIVKDMAEEMLAALSGDTKAAGELLEAAADAAVVAIQARAPVRTGRLRASIEAHVGEK
jgi:hypothetical protein